MTQHRHLILVKVKQTQRHKNPLPQWEDFCILFHKPHPTKLDELQTSEEPGLKFTLVATLIELGYKKCNRFSCHESDKVLCKFKYSPSAVHVSCALLYSVWRASILCRISSRFASIYPAYYISSSGLMAIHKEVVILLFYRFSLKKNPRL